MPLTPPYAANYSTFEAVSPAIDRTRALLFHEFRFWRFLKLSFLACLSQYPILNLILACLIYSGVLVGAVIYASVSHSHQGFGKLGDGFIAACVFFVILLFALISLGFSYLFTRLRMAYVGLLATEETEVGTAMREFGDRTWSYLGLLLWVALILVVPIALITVPAAIHFIQAFRQILPQINTSPGQPPPADFIPLIISMELGLYGVMFLVVIILRLAETTTRDLMMIPMALEQASLGESYQFLRKLLQLERARTLGHILFHALLEFASIMVAAFVAYIPVFILGLIAALLGFGLFHNTWNQGSGGQLLVIAYAVTAGIVLAACLIVLGIGATGTAAIFVQNHALEYLAPRYLPLASLMHPPSITTADPTRIPPFPAPSEPPPAGTF